MIDKYNLLFLMIFSISICIDNDYFLITYLRELFIVVSFLYHNKNYVQYLIIVLIYHHDTRIK